jgi:hypothetical protein
VPFVPTNPRFTAQKVAAFQMRDEFLDLIKKGIVIRRFDGRQAFPVLADRGRKLSTTHNTLEVTGVEQFEVHFCREPVVSRGKTVVVPERQRIEILGFDEFEATLAAQSHVPLFDGALLLFQCLPLPNLPDGVLGICPKDVGFIEAATVNLTTQSEIQSLFGDVAYPALFATFSPFIEGAHIFPAKIKVIHPSI